MSMFFQHFVLAAPLFATVLGGYLIARLPFWRPTWTQWLSKLVFTVIVPAMLFGMMSNLSALPAVDPRLLLAFFGGCFVVFVLGRVLAATVFKLDGVAQSIFGLGGVFSNNVMLGLPLARATLGPTAMPSVALVLVFNSLTLWTLVSVSIEWARHGEFSVRGFAKTAFGVLTNPVVASILAGTLYGLAGFHLPGPLAKALSVVGHLAGPAALLALGMGLVDYGLGAGWQQSVAITLLKLVAQPVVVWLLALALHLPPLESKVVVLLASMSVGVNVYLMAMQFKSMQGPVAGSLVLSTALAALTTPILLALLSMLT